MNPHELDSLILALSVILPTWIVLRSGDRGILVGAALQWILMIVAGAVLSARARDRGFNLDGLWILMGLIPCLVFCLVIHGLKLLAKKVWRFAKSSASRPPQP